MKKQSSEWISISFFLPFSLKIFNITIKLFLLLLFKTSNKRTPLWRKLLNVINIFCCYPSLALLTKESLFRWVGLQTTASWGSSQNPILVFLFLFFTFFENFGLQKANVPYLHFQSNFQVFFSNWRRTVKVFDTIFRGLYFLIFVFFTKFDDLIIQKCLDRCFGNFLSCLNSRLEAIEETNWSWVAFAVCFVFAALGWIDVNVALARI